MRRRPLNVSSEVLIDRFNKKGNGLGTTADEARRAVEVPFAIPGDKVQAMLRRKKGGIVQGQLEQVLSPSPLRIAPRCLHFASCGGCRWQQLAYGDQLKLKQEYIESLFLPLLPDHVEAGPIVPCDPCWQYRNKMEFTFSSDAAGNKYLGLIMDSSRGKVLNLTECHLVNPWFVDAIKAARGWWDESGLSAYYPPGDKGSLRTLTVREGWSSGDRMVMLTVSGNPTYALNRHQLDSFIAYMRDAVEPVDPERRLSLFLRIQQAVKGEETSFYEMQLYGPDHLRERLSIQDEAAASPVELAFDVSPSAFFQPNTGQAQKLYSLALQMLNIPSGSVVYDLYCGTGTLGICAARRAKQVIGVEISPESSLDARTNATKNGLSNIQIFTGAVSEVIGAIQKEKSLPSPDVVMVDPPRVGLDPVSIEHLAAFASSKILYISCNPATQVGNVKELIEKGYEIESLRPVDQFPHTVHIENIVVLRKRP